MLSLLCNSTCPAINWNRSGLSYMRMCLLGRRKAKRHLLSFKPWSLFTGSVIIISCQTIPVKPSEQLFNMFGSGAGGAAIRFYWDAWRSFTSAVTFLLGRFMFVYARCLPQRAKQDGLRDRAFLFRVGRNRHSCVLMMLCGYRTLHVHFGIARFFPAIPTGCDRSLLYEKERRFALAFLLL